MIRGYRHREAAAREKLLKNVTTDEVRRERATVLADRELRIELEAAQESVARARSALQAAKQHRPEQTALDAALANLAEIEAEAAKLAEVEAATATVS